MIDISIIIVNYNVKEYLIPCINSIFKHKDHRLSLEIIVIDNNSQDNSIKALEKHFDNIKIIKNKKNEGFTKAVNQGAKIAHGKYFFILNPDTYLVDNSLNIMFKLMEKNKKIALLGPAMFSPSNKIQQSYWRKPTLYNTILSLIYLDFINFSKNYKNENVKITKKVESISGGAFFVRSSIFNLMKGFDSVFFWMEDIDFCIRCIKLNYQIHYTTNAKVIHYIGKSSEKNWTLTIYNQLVSKINYFRKHHSNFESNVLKISIFYISIIKIILLIILSPIKPSYFYKLKGYAHVIKKIITKN